VASARRSGAAAAEACHWRDLTVQHVRDTPAHGCTVRGRQGAHLHTRATTGRSCIGRRGCGTIHACVLLSVGEGAHLHGRAQHEQVLDGLHTPGRGLARPTAQMACSSPLYSTGTSFLRAPRAGVGYPTLPAPQAFGGGARRKRCRARRLCLAWLGASRVRAAAASAPSCGGAPLGRHAMQRPLRGACGGSAARRQHRALGGSRATQRRSARACKSALRYHLHTMCKQISTTVYGGAGAHQRSKRQRKSELSTDAHARLSSGNTPQKHTVWQAW